ncbi:MAG: Gfo/Idh/MocA family protein [Bacteroidota bacterium]|jgi:predicted dehydrogenase|nr:Gfo/Idh/MocA family oxidoreductase [Bacteroidota bacterium]MCA6442030.1 Gfo/Idh/MocA family oxidoreductase [Bacteroidota bacterium]
MSLNIAIIGYGYWGPNLVRNFTNAVNSKVTHVVDFRPERLSLVNKMYPSIETTNNVDEIINSTKVDAVVIATPVFTHFELAKKALLNGKHVLLEKPMTSTVAEAIELIDLADKMGLLLMVDHTFLYTGAVRKMKELIERRELGTINYFDSTRINLGLFQPDVNVLWDLAPHDISILLFLINEKPLSVNATGVSHTNNGIENIAYLTTNYSSNLLAHFNCSWSSPVKLRNTLVGGDKKMVLFNDLEPSEKLRVYDTGYNYKTDEEKNKLLVDYRTGDVYIPKLEMKEALLEMANDFVQSALNKKQPVSTSQLGLEVIKILEASQTSIKSNGKEIKL